MNSVINCYYFYINKLQDFLNVMSSKFKMKICFGKYDSQLVKPEKVNFVSLSIAHD